VVIPGISGKIAQRVAKRLLAQGHHVIGIDRRPWPEAPPEIELHPVDIRKRAAEDVFRRCHPEAVIHMATVTHLAVQNEEQFRVNLASTRAVFEHAATYGIKAVVFVGRHTYYGAAADSPLFHTEDEPPVEVASFPELADLVAADLYAGSALWRHPKMRTAVLRMVYTLGPSHHGTLAGFLARPRVPTVLGFDPLFQLMHEDDAASAICLALEKEIRGVFNVAGPNALPFSMLIRAAGRTPVPLPEVLLRLALGHLGLPNLSPAALGHIKYPIVVDDKPFRAATGFHHAFSEDDAIAGFRSGT
jgi:UDP-glucose 4-epimerase